jgi:integrase/recombinase XerD
MKLEAVVTQYIHFKQSLGFKFYSNAYPLRAFCRAMGDIDIKAVRPAAARAYIAGRCPATSHCRRKFAILHTFYRYALARRFVKRSPLPMNVPAVRTQFSAYIYSTEELQRLIVATDILHSTKSRLQAHTMRMLLLLLYGTGLRVGEALALNLKDVDLDERVLTIRDTKFFKSRIVSTANFFDGGASWINHVR